MSVAPAGLWRGELHWSHRFSGGLFSGVPDGTKTGYLGLKGFSGIQTLEAAPYGNVSQPMRAAIPITASVSAAQTQLGH